MLENVSYKYIGQIAHCSQPLKLARYQFRNKAPGNSKITKNNRLRRTLISVWIIKQEFWKFTRIYYNSYLLITITL